MKKHHDLCRAILLCVEARTTFDQYGEPVEIEGYTEQEISYHVMLLHEDGLLVANSESYHSDEYDVWVPVRLTNAGHAFVENTRSDNVWIKVKENAKLLGGTVSFNILSKIAEDTVKRMLGIAA